MSMYKSPIEVCVTEMQHKFEERIEGDIIKVIHNYGISIDKEELIKALDYDRQQYEAGYRDGLNTDRWISVEDRLPEQGGAYIIYAGIVGIAWYKKGSQLWESPSGLVTEISDGLVTHWMPLPAPPEVEV